MSRSTFAGITIAKSALNASQAALQVTGQNIANVYTTGYTRQQVDVVSLSASGTSDKTSIGYGVSITSISQVRDPFLDVQYRNEIAKTGDAQACQNTLDELGDIFDETDQTALKSALESLSSALDDLSSNVGVSSYETLVRSNCEVLVSYIKQKASDLDTLREETTTELEDTDIPDVNEILSEISDLNDSIWNSQVIGNSALELTDQRNSLIDALASYLPISVTYSSVQVSDSTSFDYPVITLNGADGTNYSLTAGEHGENYATFSVERNTDSDGTEDGTVSISLVPATDYDSAAAAIYTKTDITDNLDSGAISGIVSMLNDSGELDSPSTDTRGIGYYEKVLDAFAQSFAETFNTLNASTSTYTGASSIPSSGTTTALTSTGTENAEYSLDFSSSTGNFLKNEYVVINGQKYTFGSGNNGTVAIGDSLAESLANLTDSLNSSSSTLQVNGTDMDGTWAYDSSTGKLTWTSNDTVASGTELTSSSITATDGTDLEFNYKANPLNVVSYDLFEASDGSSTINANNISVSDNWLDNTISIISSTEDDAGTTANDNILRMIDALSADRDFNYKYTYQDKNGDTQTGSINIFSGSYLEFYSNLENVQGTDSSANSSALNLSSSVLSDISDSRDEVSGVSLDEEGINLLQYQRSFTAASRLMTTLDEALETLLSDTGVVGR